MDCGLYSAPIPVCTMVSNGKQSDEKIGDKEAVES